MASASIRLQHAIPQDRLQAACRSIVDDIPRTCQNIAASECQAFNLLRIHVEFFLNGYQQCIAPWGLAPEGCRPFRHGIFPWSYLISTLLLQENNLSYCAICLRMQHLVISLQHMSRGVQRCHGWSAAGQSPGDHAVAQETFAI